LNGLAQAEASKRHGGILKVQANDSKDEPMKQHTPLQNATALSACTTLAVDLTKRVFQIAAEDASGQVIYEQRIKSRQAFGAFLASLPAGLTILMETGPSAQAWARQLSEQGHAARILPAQHVARAFSLQLDSYPAALKKYGYRE